MGQITDIYKSHDSAGKVCKIVFTIDESETRGILHFTHEKCVGYDLRTKKWSGDEINSDGWVTLYPEELENVVKKYDLDTKVDEILKSGGSQ